jgi:hypothetical protein
MQNWEVNMTIFSWIVSKQQNQDTEETLKIPDSLLLVQVRNVGLSNLKKKVTHAHEFVFAWL